MKHFLFHPMVSFVLKIVISASLLVALFYYVNVDEIIRTYNNANKPLLVLGFVLTMANTGLHFLRWRYLLHLIAPNITNNSVFTSLMVGVTAGFFTPGQIGEVAGRIASHPELRKSQIIGITLIDKLYLLVLSLITGITSLALFAVYYSPAYWNMWYVYPVLFIIALLLFVGLFPQSMKYFLRFIPSRIREHKFYAMVNVIETAFHNTQGRVLFTLTTLLYTIIVLQFYIFVIAFEQISLFNSALCTLSVYFIKAVILPISIGDLGVRESAAVLFFTQVGVSAASALSASLCMFLANIVLPSAVGALLILRLKPRWSK